MLKQVQHDVVFQFDTCCIWTPFRHGVVGAFLVKRPSEPTDWPD